MNCYQIFDSFFLQNNPFFDICDRGGIEVEGSLFGSAFGGVHEPKLPAMPTIEIVVPTTLKEFYNGCIKTVSYSRQIVALDGKTISQQTNNRQVEVKPGMDSFDNIKWRGEGNQQPGKQPSSLYIDFQLAPPNPSS